MFYILFYTDFSENTKPIVNQIFTMGFTLNLAVRTGLEPATPCVTGMYSNQLNYRTVLFIL